MATIASALAPPPTTTHTISRLTRALRRHSTPTTTTTFNCATRQSPLLRYYCRTRLRVWLFFNLLHLQASDLCCAGRASTPPRTISRGYAYTSAQTIAHYRDTPSLNSCLQALCLVRGVEGTMLRITASTRRVATGGWIHRGAVVRGASTFQQLQVEQRDGGKTETSSALESAPQKVSLPAEETKKLGAALVSVGGVSSSRVPSWPPRSRALTILLPHPALYNTRLWSRANQDPVHRRLGNPSAKLFHCGRMEY